MTEFQNKYGHWALVAGAALGLGEAFCISLAKKGMNIVMVDKQENPLHELSDKLIAEYSIKTLTLAIDLSENEATDQIMEETSKLDCRLMIYNAAYSKIRKFTDQSREDIDQYLSVNIGTQLKLTHSFSARLIEENKAGGILLMSSLAGLLGMQFIAPYAASKAFAWNLAESLSSEFKPYSIDVTACIAGATATEAYLSTNPQSAFFKPQVQQPQKVATSALEKLGKKALYISGFGNRVNYFILTRLLPRKVAAKMANKTMLKMFPHI